MIKIKSHLLVLIFLASFTACSGGGGGGDDSGGNPDPVDGSAAQWKVSAEIAQDGCGERIADVNQTFAVSDSGNSVTVNTGVVTVTGTNTDNGFTTGFSETNGTCSRSYTAEFIYTSSTTASVNLVSNSNCAGVICENKWLGTATRTN